MRQVVLDTETTGLEVQEGHRILEIGCVEIIDRKLTRRHYHQYINPQRDIDEGALEVHGITSQFLNDKPVFNDVWEAFLEFVNGSELARNKHPGQKNNLDALCKRYNVDNSQRELHGALLDAEILADVYLLLTGGQVTLGLGDESQASTKKSAIARLDSDRPELRVIKANVEEMAAHEERLDALEKTSENGAVWRARGEAEA